MDKKQIPKEIEPFIKKIRTEFNPEKIILFGSKAKGTDWKRSDYDFIIVSKRFEKMHWLKRISKIVSFWDKMSDIDILPYTPKEFQNKKNNSSIVRDAMKHGILIAE